MTLLQEYFDGFRVFVVELTYDQDWSRHVNPELTVAESVPHVTELLEEDATDPDITFNESQEKGSLRVADQESK